MLSVLMISAALLGQTPDGASPPSPPPAPAAETTTSSAWRPPLTATLGFGSQYATHRSYDLVDDDDVMPTVRAAVGYGFQLPRALLDVELGYQSGGTSASLHGLRESSLWLHGVDVGATYRYSLFKYLQPYAGIAAGYEWATLEAGALQQRVGSPRVTAMAGLGVPLVLIPRDGQDHALFFVDFGVGYTLRPLFAFDAMKPEPPAKPAPDAIPIAPLDLGRMELSGLTWRLALTFRL